MMWCIIGKKKSSPQKVNCTLGLLNSNACVEVNPIRSRPGTTHKPGYWSDKENRKKFLLEFAEKMGFDPMIAENWQGQFYHILAAGVTSSHFK